MGMTHECQMITRENDCALINRSEYQYLTTILSAPKLHILALIARSTVEWLLDIKVDRVCVD